MKGNIGQMMKQAQMMQENMRRMQEQLGSLEVEGQSGSGAVKVLMTCKLETRRVSIDPSLMTDREMLEDLLVAAPRARRRVPRAPLESRPPAHRGRPGPAPTAGPPRARALAPGGPPAASGPAPTSRLTRSHGLQSAVQ